MQEMVPQSELTWAHTHKSIPAEPSHPSNSTDLTAFHFTLMFFKINTTEGKLWKFGAFRPYRCYHTCQAALATPHRNWLTLFQIISHPTQLLSRRKSQQGQGFSVPYLEKGFETHRSWRVVTRQKTAVQAKIRGLGQVHYAGWSLGDVITPEHHLAQGHSGSWFHTPTPAHHRCTGWCIWCLSLQSYSSLTRQGSNLLAIMHTRGSLMQLQQNQAQTHMCTSVCNQPHGESTSAWEVSCITERLHHVWCSASSS